VISAVISTDQSHPAGPGRLHLSFFPGRLPLLNLRHEPSEINLRLHGRTITNRVPTPRIPPLTIGAGREQRPQDQQVAVRAGKVERRIPVHISIAEQRVRAAGREGEQDLEAGVVAGAAGLDDGVTAAGVPAGDGLRVLLAQQVHDLGVAGGAGDDERGLVVLVQADAGGFVAEGEQGADDGQVAELAGQVQRGIGEPAGREVWIVQEVWRVRVADSRDQERVICVDGPAKAQGGVDPRWDVSYILYNYRRVRGVRTSY
jgi:hypothetical protein